MKWKNGQKISSVKTKNRIKLFIKISGLFFLIFFFSSISCVFFLETDFARNFLIEKINENLIGRFSFQKLDISLISGRIELLKPELTGTADTPLIKSGSLGLKIEWARLFAGELFITDIFAEKPELHLFETAGGQLNLMAAFKPSAKSGKKAGIPLPFNIIIKNARINDAVISFAAGNIATSIFRMNVRSDYNLAENSGSLNLEIPYGLLDTPKFHTVFAPAVLKISMQDGNIKSLDLDAVTPFGRGISSGQIHDIFKDPFLDLQLDLMANLEDVKKACGLDIRMTGQAAAVMTVKGKAGNPETDLRLILHNARLDKFTTVIASLEAIMKNRQAFLKLETCDKNKNNTKSKCYIDFASAFPFSFFRGVRNMEKIHYGFETSLENLDIHNFIPSPASELQGNISGKISADFKGINPSKMNFKASANISGRNFSLKQSEKPSSLNLKADISGEKGMFRIPSAILTAGDSKLSADGWFLSPARSFKGQTELYVPDLKRLAAFAGIRKAGGAIKASGNFSGSFRYPVFNAKIDGKDVFLGKLHPGTINIDAGMDESGRLKIAKLNVKNSAATINASGSADIGTGGKKISKNIRTDLKISIKNFEPGLFWTGKLPVSGIFNADISADNKAGSTYARLVLSGRNISACGIEIGSAESSASISDGLLDISDLTIKNKNSVMGLEGGAVLFTGHGIEINKNPVIRAKIRNADLKISDFVSDIKGRILASGSLGGTLEKPSGNMEITGDNIEYGQITIDSAIISATLEDERLKINNAEIRSAPAQNIAMSGWIDKTGVFSADIAGRKISMKNFGKALSMPHLEGLVSADIKMSGDFKNPGLDGLLTFTNFGTKEENFRNFELEINLENNLFRMNSIPEKNIFDFRADLLKKDFEAGLKLDEFTFTPFLKASGLDEFDGKADLRFTAKGNIKNPDLLNAYADIKNLGINFRNSPIVRCGKISASLEKGIFAVSPTELQIMEKGRANLSGRWTNEAGMNFSIKSFIGLEDAARLVPDLTPDLSGNIEAFADIRGNAAKPAISGEISIKNVSFTIPETSRKLHDLDGKIVLTPENIKLEKIRGDIEQGNFRLNGNAGLDGLKITGIDIRLRSRSIPVSIPDYAELACNINLDLEGTGDKAVLSGETVILEGIYYRDADLSLVSMPKKPERKKPPVWESIQNPFLRNTGLDITLKRREPLAVDNNVADFELSPDLKITGRISEPLLSGRCTIEPDGVVYYRKNEIKIKKGVIYFINPYRPEPEFDIESTAQIRDWLVTLKISGVPEKLFFSLSSDPALEDNDIISLVLTGKIAKEISSGQAARKPASEMLGEMLASTFSDDIKTAAGLDIFETGSGSNELYDSTKVTIGKNLSKRMSVKYSVESGAEDVRQKAMAEYRLLENIILDGFSDSKGIYGGELQFRLEFR